MQPVEVCASQHAVELAERIKSQSDKNGAVVKGFFGQNATLLSWAEEFCKLGEPVKDQLCYYEGHKAEEGESFLQQLQRQLEEDFKECGQALADEGAADWFCNYRFWPHLQVQWDLL